MIGAEITNDDSPTDLDGADQSEALFNNKQDVTPRSIVVNELANAGKVTIEKFRGEVSLMEQDTIENVSKPIKFLKKIIFLILSEKTILFYATF